MQINIPQRLKAVRENRNLTQKKVAIGISMKPGTYQTYEEGRATPPVPVLIKLATFYNLTIDQLLGLEAENEQPKVLKAYQCADEKDRKIVDLVLNLNC